MDAAVNRARITSWPALAARAACWPGRLAQSGATVILLEAGGPDRTRLVRKPGMIAIFHNVPR